MGGNNGNSDTVSLKNLKHSFTPTVRTRLVIFILLSLSIFGCNKQPIPENHFTTPTVVNYSVSQFTNLQALQARLLWKIMFVYTNQLSNSGQYFFTICLEKTNSEVICVSGDPTSRDWYYAISLLETNHSYQFPNALIELNPARSP